MQRIVLLKAKHWILSVTAFLVIALVLSCQRDDQVLNQDIVLKSSRTGIDNSSQDSPQADDFQVRQGTLYFKDNNAFIRIHKFLATKSHDERLKFAQAAGFKSLLTYQDEFIKECDAAEAAQDRVGYKATVAKYADIVSPDSAQTLVFAVQSSLLASYQDRTGVLYIGQALYKFGDREQTIILDGDRTKLNASESSVVKHISHKLDAGTMKGGRRSSTCRYFEDKVVFGDCGDRHSRLSVVPLFNTMQQGNGQYTTIVTPYSIAFPFKKNFYGWVHYTTDNTMFAHWTFTAYTTEPNQTNGPNNPLYSYANTVLRNNDSQIEYNGQVTTFSNLNNSNGGSIFYQFDFPTDNGWHEMICVHNDMSCP